MIGPDCDRSHRANPVFFGAGILRLSLAVPVTFCSWPDYYSKPVSFSHRLPSTNLHAKHRLYTAGKIYVQSAGPRSDWTACPVTCPVASFGLHDAVTVSRDPSEPYVSCGARLVLPTMSGSLPQQHTYPPVLNEDVIYVQS
jgi:hypothetical protein